MKKQLTLVSIIVNVALIASLLWARTEHRKELREFAQVIMSADENYIGLLTLALGAIESPDAEETENTVGLLRTIVATGEQNIAARDRAGLKR